MIGTGNDHAMEYKLSKNVFLSNLQKYAEEKKRIKLSNPTHSYVNILKKLPRRGIS
jgi:hypothetical protein